MLKRVYPIFLLFLFWSCSGSKNTAQLPKENDFSKNEKVAVAFGQTYTDGAKEKILGNYDAALKKFNKALDLNSKSGAAHYEIGNILSIRNLPEQAIESYKNAVKLDPENYWYQLSLATTLRDLNKSKEAIEAFTQLVKNESSRIELKYELAQLLLNDNRKEEGIEVMNQIEQELGVTEEVSFLKQRVYLSQNKLDEAAAEIQKLIDNNPNEIRYYGALADTYANNGRKKEALKVYQQMQALDSNNYRLQFSLAEFYRQENNQEQFKKYLFKSFSSSEMNIDDKIKYVLNFYQVDSKNKAKKQEAIELCKIISNTHPENAKGYALLADFQYFDNQIENAKNTYIKTLSIDSSRFPIWNQLIFIFADQADTSQLVDYSRRAIELFPNQPTVYLTYGIGLSQQNKHGEAIEYLELGKDLVLSNPSLKSQFFSSLGDAYHSLKKHELSDKNYDNALQLDPNNVIVLNNYSYYLSVRNKNLEKAKEMSAKSNSLSPNEASFEDTYAWILFQLKDYENALLWINKAMKNSKAPSGEMLEHKGDILYKNGRTEEAIDFWKKAETKGNTSDKIELKIKTGSFHE